MRGANGKIVRNLSGCYGMTFSKVWTCISTALLTFKYRSILLTWVNF